MKRKKTVLITGIAGFGGSHLADFLLERNFRVHGILAPGEKTTNINHIKKELGLDRCDIRKEERIKKLVKSIKPDHLYHLAAFASVGQSFVQERLAYEINFFGTFNILQGLIDISKPNSRMLYIGSGDTYGIVSPINKTLSEADPLKPYSPYGVSKSSAELMISYYHSRYGLKAVRVRPFNHIGPRQSEVFAIPSFCKQIAELENSRKKAIIKVGDLTVKRDLSDVRDIVQGYYLTVQKGKPGGVYNLSSGRSVALSSVLNNLLRMSSKKIEVKIDKKRLRKSDIPVLRGTNRKAVKELGWHCRYKLNDTLMDTLNYWREQIRK